MSLHDEKIFAERALRAGANGYLMKHEATAKILAAVRTVLSGGIYLSEAMHLRLAQKVATPSGSTATPIAGLSQREFEILHLIGLGFGTRQISEKLNRSIKTIEAHRASRTDSLCVAVDRRAVTSPARSTHPPETGESPRRDRGLSLMPRPARGA